MKFLRQTLAVLLAVLMLAVPVTATESENWLIPKMREDPEFTDTAGTICQEAARICCEAGLMTGVDAKHFMPETGLTNAQIIVISARLHRLLKTGTVGEFDSYHLPRDQWWNPYDKYLREQIPVLADSKKYAWMCESPTTNCYRETFFLMLADILESAETELPVINDVDAVPDCMDPKMIQFYRAGILGGKDAYGTLVGDGALSRAAASSMLARLIAPDQRLHLNLETWDLCKLLLDVETDAPLMVINGQTITAEQFIVPYVLDLSLYNHNHLGNMFNYSWPGDDSVGLMARYVQLEEIAAELGMDLPESEETYYDGYQGFTAAGQKWNAEHEQLFEDVLAVLGKEDLPPLPEIQYTEYWDRDRLIARDYLLYQAPVWGGGM